MLAESLLAVCVRRQNDRAKYLSWHLLAHTARQVLLLGYKGKKCQISYQCIPVGRCLLYFSSLSSLSLWPQTLSDERGFLPQLSPSVTAMCKELMGTLMKLKWLRMSWTLRSLCHVGLASDLIPSFMLRLSRCHNKRVWPIFQRRNLPLNTS